MKTTISIKGMHCSSCKALIEDICQDIEGVESCNVDESTDKALINHKENLDLQILKKEIEDGNEYQVTLENN
ncbi:MAG: cation transporter [Candidatus Kerfeldbacteria bacterium]|jgi:P-type Cu+ transporter